MTNETKNQQQEAPDAADFLGGAYLKKEDMEGPIVVTITETWWEKFRNDPKKKIVMSFKELAKPLILNTKNALFLSQHFRTTKSLYWRGPITLYVDPNVMYGPRRVGGIRIKPAEVQAQPQPPVTAPQVEQQPQPTQPQVQPETGRYPNGAAADGHLRSSEADVY